NYTIGRVDLSPSRVEHVLAERAFDCALFEYWHATPAVGVLRQRGIPCLLDMHDILWRSYGEELAGRAGLPAPVREWAVRRYRASEEAAWRQFDALAAINRSEFEDLKKSGIPESTRIFYAPMGVDLARWPYAWKPSRPLRLGFYGALHGSANQRAA